ncbi:MAG: hypothetical protein OEN20_06105 [Gammaproteobacteria bacterium]|nr:hypothetical protein [Gammaproteobacteria bacterium]
MPSALTESTLKALLANLGRYLANLARAGRQRKEESRQALQGVIRATRQTKVYLRALEARGKRDFDREARLSDSWTELSFELRKLDVKALAKRCDIAGGYWSDPDKFSDAFLVRAKVRLQDLEMEARALLAKL